MPSKEPWVCDWLLTVNWASICPHLVHNLSWWVICRTMIWQEPILKCVSWKICPYRGHRFFKFICINSQMPWSNPKYKAKMYDKLNPESIQSIHVKLPYYCNISNYHFLYLHRSTLRRDMEYFNRCNCFETLFEKAKENLNFYFPLFCPWLQHWYISCIK